jgi:hypothetical protein
LVLLNRYLLVDTVKHLMVQKSNSIISFYFRQMEVK